MTKALRSIHLLVCLAALAVATPAYAQAKKADKKADEKTTAAAPAQPPAKKGPPGKKDQKKSRGE